MEVVIRNGIYELHGSVGDRLLDMLPDVTAVPAGPRTRGPLEMLSLEAERDEPGQDAVLNRLLDLVLVIALRSWGANAGTELPTWLGAAADLLRDTDATVAAIAHEVSYENAFAFSVAFKRNHGHSPKICAESLTEPPLTACPETPRYGRNQLTGKLSTRTCARRSLLVHPEKGWQFEIGSVR